MACMPAERIEGPWCYTEASHFRPAIPSSAHLQILLPCFLQGSILPVAEAHTMHRSNYILSWLQPHDMFEKGTAYVQIDSIRMPVILQRQLAM